jgi:hypothetical protein
MEVEIRPVQIYEGMDWEIIPFLVEMSDLDRIIRSGAEFRVFANGAELRSTYFYDVLNDEWIVEPAELGPGSYEIRIEGSYEGKVVSRSIPMEVREALEVELSTPSVIVSGQEVRIGLELSYYGNETSLRFAGVELRLNNTLIEAEVEDEALSFLAPELDPGTYELEITIGYRNISKQIRAELSYGVMVEGRAVDANAQPLTGHLIFRRAGFLKEISINGDYSGYIPPGVYELDLMIPPALKMARFRDVEVMEDVESFFNYDWFGSKLKVHGLKVAGGVALELSLPFSSVTLDVWYDAARVRDETRLKAYKCDNWNLARRSCASDWVEVVSRLDTIRDIVTITTNSLSGFVIGEALGLEMIAQTDKPDYWLEDHIVVTGVVRDDLENPVEGAVVSYELDGKKGLAKSGRDGIFTLSLTAPSEEGFYDIVLRAWKEKYENGTKRLSIRVRKKIELSLVFSPSYEVIAGQNSSFDVNIFNSGQTDLHNLRIRVSGLPKWVDWEPSSIALLKAGEERAITFDSHPPQETMPTSLRIGIEVEVDELREADSFVLLVKPRAEAKAPVGFLVLPAEVLVGGLYLILVSVVAFAFVLFLRWRHRFRPLGKREEVMRIINGIVGEVKRVERRAEGKKKYGLLGLKKW